MKRKARPCDDQRVRRLAIALVLLAGCDRVFGLDTVRGDAAATDGTGSADGSVAGTCGSPGPNQELVASSMTGATIVPTHATVAGSTLVLVAAVESKTDMLASVTDDAGNTWRRGARSPSTGASQISVELWYAVGAAPATQITATSGATSFPAAVNFTEWPCALIRIESAADSSSGATPSGPAVTGAVTTADPALVIGAVVLPGSSTNPARSTPGYADLTMFFGDLIDGEGVWAWKPPGTYSAAWGLEGVSDWVGAMIAITMH